jgi:hypothetical protein
MSYQETIKDYLPKSEFPAGKQTEVTPLIQEISHRFDKGSLVTKFSDIHEWIYSNLEILPYTDEPEVRAEEAMRRWKLTADEVLRVGTVFEGKECNDVVMIFLAISKALGYDGQLAKCFRKNEQGDILVHSIAIITDRKNKKQYAVNAGSKNKYWVTEGSWDFDTGPVMINDWYVWRAGDDQWSMGLNDSSQEKTTIVKDAMDFYSQEKN